MKVGAYETTFKHAMNNANDRFSHVVEPLVFIVLSVDERDNAHTILSFRDFALERRGVTWNFWPGPITSSEIRFPLDPPVKPLVFRWKDRNGGTCISYGAAPYYQAKFTRLDG